MIAIAKKQNFHPKIEYSVASIEDWSTVKQWKEQMTKVISIHCFHWGVDDCVPDSHHHKYDALYYKKMLESIGFEVLHSKERKIDVFSSDEDIKNFFTALCVLTPHVPLNRKEDFQNDLLEELLLHNGRDSNGMPYHDGKILELVVRKKIKN
ncbi:hypothetical protein TNIN_306331 [Trichonephila inaurata madagascariensis]|uniref:Uncharacterized protein n=1 Tax=Trichonephila inaurata madagascariensis TaxID=2747483 RepID=A0A8X6Y030_9ARAC|nr:hypothetical protein TNIN_306331 [Trichonephila inaurata madagascariensis]